MNYFTILVERARQWNEKRSYDACAEGFISSLLLEWNSLASFESILTNTIKQTPFPLRILFENAIHRVREKGMSMDESLELVSREWSTTIGLRTCSLLRHAYKNGCTRSTREALHYLGEDVREYVKVQWKTYANKLVVYSLVFIGFSALVPALFLAFVTIGSRFLELSLSPHDILFASWVLFPFLDVLVLVFVHVQKPPTPSMQHQTIPLHDYSIVFLVNQFHAWKKRLNELILMNGNSKGVEGMFYTCTICSAGLFVVSWTFYLRNPILNAFWISVFLFAVACPFLAYGILQLVLFEKNTHNMEKQAGESLLLLSSIPETVSFVAQLEWVAHITPNPLKEAWKKIIHQIKKGKNPVNAFDILSHARNSSILESVSALLRQTYENGAPFGESARELAQKIASQHASIHERRATLLVEKYTILLAGGVLVPFLLGILTGVVTALPLSSTTDLIPSGADALFSSALHGVRGYLLLYACIAGLFVGMQENKWGEGLAYSLILLPCSQIVFMIGQAWIA